MKSEELLPCPFCGKELDVNDDEVIHPNGVRWKDGEHGREYSSLTTDNRGYELCYTIYCSCEQGGCGVRMTDDSKEMVIDNWNKRVGK